MDNDHSSYEFLDVEVRGLSLHITINRPDVLNALSEGVLQELGYVLLNNVEEDMRTIVISGQGPKAFVAGADIAPMAELDVQDALRFAKQGQMVMSTLEKLPQVTIAKVDGFALGGGCELAMCCDIIVASENSLFGQPEVNLGLIPGFGATQRLPKRVGLPQALDMLLTGRGKSITAIQALQYGLISRVVPANQLDAEVDKIIADIQKTSFSAVAETKRLAREALHMTLENGLESEAAAFALRFAHPDVKEGVGAFLEKRKPEFNETL